MSFYAKQLIIETQYKHLCKINLNASICTVPQQHEMEELQKGNDCLEKKYL